MARGGYAVAALTLAALVLSGCSSTRMSSRTASTQPPALQPLPSSTVAQGNLPPIGQDGSVTVAQPGMVNPNLTGQPTTTGPSMTPAPLTPAVGADPGLQTAKQRWLRHPRFRGLGSRPARPRPLRRPERGKAPRRLDRRLRPHPVPAQPDPDGKVGHQPLPRLDPRLPASAASPPSRRGSSRARRSSCSTRTTTWSRR